ncbi:MAG: DUF1549 domain-containing protein, partial [Pirellulaceae bacterium]|nr:DUF1549 domain-containing protein [Pirellulaceae bacterium]
DSLILRKPSGRAPHVGGRRLPADSAHYRVIRDWIAAGAPGPDPATPRVEQLRIDPSTAVVRAPQHELQLRVTARFSNGSERDVTNWSVYEASNFVATASPRGLVSRNEFGETTITIRYLQVQAPVRVAFIPQQENFTWRPPAENNYIDRFVARKLKLLHINPSPLCSDGVFVRRAFLDAIGALPTSEEARSFIADRDPQKRKKLIDALLERPEYADFWTLKWGDLLRNEEKLLDVKGVESFHKWIRESIAADKGVDQFVRELLTARGSTYDNPPANFFRANRDPTTRSETTARLFLGSRLQCARCHNHPFDRWTQRDYYSWAAMFARIDYRILKNGRRDRFDKNEFVGEQIVLVRDEGEVRNPRTGRDARPQLLGAETPELDQSTDRLPLTAEWMTSPDNRRFSEVRANWIWWHLLGRGLVEPIDDFRVTNPASHPNLLGELGADFAKHEFSTRHLVRTIMNSRTYQLSAQPTANNRRDQVNYSHAYVRRLTAEQLLDAQCQVIGRPPRFAGYPVGMRAMQMPGVRRVRRRESPPQTGDQFLAAFGKPERILACECERSNETTLSQALLLVGGKGINRLLAEPDNRLDKLARSDRAVDHIIDELYWSALTRSPTESERTAAAKLLNETDDRFAALQDITWALLNAKEFLFRR